MTSAVRVVLGAIAALVSILGGPASEPRACGLVGQHRSTNRYAPVPAEFETKLVARMTKLAERHPRWGYRMIHALLVEEGWPVNKKRIERLWRQEGLQLPPKARNPMGRRRSGTTTTVPGGCHRCTRTTSGPATS